MLISPILASLAVGIGVPILLFYVYGVVPVSLCRSGGCGVSTSGTGVRFDFDDEGDMIGVLATKSSGKFVVFSEFSTDFFSFFARNAFLRVILNSGSATSPIISR